MAVKEDRPYEFEPSFEKQAVTLACLSPSFFGRVGSVLDPDLLSFPPAKDALLAAQAFAREVGRGPESLVLVIEKLRAWMSEGKVTKEQVDAVWDMFDDAEDSGLPSIESAVNLIKPKVQRRMHLAAMRAGMADYAKKGDLRTVREILDRADRIGELDDRVGTEVGGEGFSTIERVRHLGRIKTGILELDGAIEGGMPRGGLTVVIGSSGAGKSIFLTHSSASAMRLGLLVGYATLELDEATVHARINSNLTNIPINSLVNGHLEAARVKLDGMKDKIGKCVVCEFPARQTTPEDIFDWVKRVEAKFGRKMDLLAIDYMDLMFVRGIKDKSEYEIGRLVSAALHEYAKTSGCVVATAAQSKGRGEQAHGKRRKIDLGDVADSMHKVRIADLVLTLNGDDDNEEVSIFVAKHRVGKARMTVGPLPTMFECGMITAIGAS